MNKAALMLALFLCGFRASGQENTLTVDEELVRSAQEWARENLDESVLRSLPELDQQKVRQFLNQLQKQYNGEYVLDLAQFKETAKAVLPVLEAYEETVPYAAWLKANLDYFDVANKFRLLVPPARPIPGQPFRRAPNPSPQKARQVWTKEIAQRPWPEAAKPYVDRLKPIFAEEKVPPELIWIAEVESSFDPRARSPVGAAGLFQLMPDTAHRFRLRTWPMDQRLQPEPSGRAAAQYLRYLHGLFKDWRLALAAYNSGEGTVQNLLNRGKASDFDSIAIRLPAETQMFVPRVEATLLRREGLSLNQLQAAPPAAAD